MQHLRSSGDPTTIASACARDTATFGGRELVGGVTGFAGRAAMRRHEAQGV